MVDQTETTSDIFKRGRPLVVLPTHANDFPFPYLNDWDWKSPQYPVFKFKIKCRITHEFQDIEVSGLCPFCDHPLGPRLDSWFIDLPRTTMKTLPLLMKHALELSHPERRASNECGRVAGKHDTTSLCNQHLYESMLLPLSIQYNWPRQIDFKDVLRRCQSPEMTKSLVFVYDNPWLSAFVKKDMKPTFNLNLLRLNLIFDLRPTAGYYGQRGWAILKAYSRSIIPMLQSQSSKAASMYSSDERLAEIILIPELACQLTMQDYQCSRSDARFMVWLSEPYGELEFPAPKYCPVLRSVHNATINSTVLAIERKAKKERPKPRPRKKDPSKGKSLVSDPLLGSKEGEVERKSGSTDRLLHPRINTHRPNN